MIPRLMLFVLLIFIVPNGNLFGAEKTTAPAQHSGEESAKEAGMHFPHHHLALFVGAATETKRDVEKKTQLAVGPEYELRLQQYCGIGALVEFVGDDVIREVIVLVPLSAHFYKDFRFVAAPGFEFAEKEDALLVRTGLGYEFHLGKGFTLAPELNADFIEGGKITYVYGFALGIEF